MNRLITKFLKTIFETIGILSFDGGRVKRIIFIAALISGASLMVGYPIQHRHSIEDVAGGTLFAVCSTSLVINYFMFLANSKDIRKLLIIVDDGIFTYTTEPEVTSKYKWILKEENIVFFCKFLIYYFYIIVGILFVISLFLTLFLEVEALPFLIWMPFDLIYVKYLTQIFIGIIFVSADYVKCVFPFIICLEFERQCERLCAALATIESRSKLEFDFRYPNNPSEEITVRITCTSFHTLEASTSEGGDGKIERPILQDPFATLDRLELQSRYHKILEENLKQCIRHYQQLRRAFLLFGSLFEIVFSVNLLVCLIICVTTLIMSFMPMSLERKAAGCVGSHYFILETYICCYMGNKFLEISDRIQEVIFYQTEWYRQPAEIKRLLIIFHALVQARPFTLSAFKCIPASYRTFSGMCQKIYSYFNMLKSAL